MTKSKKEKYGKTIVIGILSLCLAGIVGGIIFFYCLVKGLPSIASLKDYRPSIITRVYANGGELIDEFYLEDRQVIQITRLPKFVIQAFVAAEDARFFHHKGVDILSIARAFIKNLQAGTIVQGGSTITQQVAKSLFLTPKKSYIRKLREAILAYKINTYLDKYEILNLYLNHIYLGHGAYGIEAASQRYFGKSAENLTLPEAALLGGLPKAPSTYSPYLYKDRALARRSYVLNRMAEDGYITEEEKASTLNAPIKLADSEKGGRLAPYFTENVRRYIQKRYGSEVLYREGLEVYTTLDVAMQKAARSAMRKGLLELDKRQGYRGVLKKIPQEEFDSFLEAQARNAEQPLPITGQIVEALVTSIDSEKGSVELRVGPYRGVMLLKDMSWARPPDPQIAYGAVQVKDPADVLHRGDIIRARILNMDSSEESKLLHLALEQEPEVQGALLCIETKTGKILAMIGGRDYRKSEFNRATQARRQPGSAFKPFIYTAAFDKGMTPATIVMDTPVIYKDILNDTFWKPQNFEEKFYGPTLLRTGLIKSRNLVTIKVLKDIGINYAADYAANLGIKSPLTKDLSMALGSSGVTLIEMVSAFSVFSSNGQRAEPYFIKKIVDRTDHVLEEYEPSVEQVVDPRIAYITSNLLQNVVQSGTGRRVKALGRPVAGKTGTTNDLKDAWFIGFTPSLVAGVWVGFDDLRPLGKYETGSQAASPIFLYFMKEALAGTPIEFFTPPKGVVFVKIDPETGLLAKPDSENSVFECFLEGTTPTEFTTKDHISPKGGFFRYDMNVQQPESEKEEWPE